MILLAGRQRHEFFLDIALFSLATIFLFVIFIETCVNTIFNTELFDLFCLFDRMPLKCFNNVDLTIKRVLYIQEMVWSKCRIRYKDPNLQGLDVQYSSQIKICDVILPHIIRKYTLLKYILAASFLKQQITFYAKQHTVFLRLILPQCFQVLQLISTYYENKLLYKHCHNIHI